jgi:hypothetical protein
MKEAIYKLSYTRLIFSNCDVSHGVFRLGAQRIYFSIFHLSCCECWTWNLVSVQENEEVRGIHGPVKLCKVNEHADYARKNARQVVTGLQTSCYKSVHKLSISCVCTACSKLL